MSHSHGAFAACGGGALVAAMLLGGTGGFACLARLRAFDFTASDSRPAIRAEQARGAPSQAETLLSEPFLHLVLVLRHLPQTRIIRFGMKLHF